MEVERIALDGDTPGQGFALRLIRFGRAGDPRAAQGRAPGPGGRGRGGAGPPLRRRGAGLPLRRGGPGRALDLARAVGAVVILTSPGASVDSFDFAVAQRWGEAPASRFAATVELRGLLDVDGALADGDAARLYRYFAGLSTVRDDLPPVASPEPLVADADLAEYVPTPVGGAVLYEVAVGDRVRAGQRMAQVLPEAGEPRHEVPAPAEGFVMSRREKRFLRRGEDVIKILRHAGPGG